ncbi:MAG: hypothetical protein R3284_07665 [Rubricoccaceae bacterium]|nr:hypothetical protein [Rubricoccaceae bacterium]
MVQFPSLPLLLSGSSEGLSTFSFVDRSGLLLMQRGVDAKSYGQSPISSLLNEEYGSVPTDSHTRVFDASTHQLRPLLHAQLVS